MRAPTPARARVRGSGRLRVVGHVVGACVRLGIQRGVLCYQLLMWLKQYWCVWFVIYLPGCSSMPCGEWAVFWVYNPTVFRACRGIILARQTCLFVATGGAKSHALPWCVCGPLLPWLKGCGDSLSRSRQKACPRDSTA